MEMSLDYLRETVEFLGTKGFTSDREEIPFERDGETVYTTERYLLTRDEDERFGFSCIRYPDGEETYWLEILDFHGLRTFDIELDSWKYRDDTIELKYYGREDGVGLSFRLELAEAG